MNQLYDLVGISKQALHQYNKRKKQQAVNFSHLLREVDMIRKDHPRMGVRDIYHKLKPEGIGRDRFEALMFEHGYRLKRVKSYKRTTYAQSLYSFPNLINGLELTGPNQLWQTDITYFEVGQRHYYLSFILDVYTRKIVGYSASDHMRAEANRKALKMAFNNTKKHGFKGLIHHSDRGKQYIESEYLKMLLNKDIRLSHAYFAVENAYAERLNGIIKNDYLKHYNIKSLKQLQQKVKRVVWLYNYQRPHKKLPGKMTPDQVEKLGIKYKHKVFNFSTSINKEKRTKKESLH